jgi:hypothetical protein
LPLLASVSNVLVATHDRRHSPHSDNLVVF